jgi:hypothetical protein
MTSTKVLSTFKNVREIRVSSYLDSCRSNFWRTVGELYSLRHKRFDQHDYLSNVSTIACANALAYGINDWMYVSISGAVVRVAPVPRAPEINAVPLSPIM